MASNKRLIAAGAAAGGAGAFDPLQNFETVTYTGNGSTQKITGYIRKGAAFNGSSSKILIGEFAGLNTSDYSVSLWFNHDSSDTSTNNRRLIQLNCSSAGDAGLFDMMFKQSTFEFTIRSGSTGTTILSYTSNATELPDDTWNHIAVTRDNTTNLTTLYINGTNVKEQTQAEGSTFGAFSSIGCRASGDLQVLGKIDQVRIFNTELNSTQVGALEDEEYGDSTVSTTDFGGYGGIALYQLDEDADDTGGSFGSLVTGSEIDLDVDGYTSGSVSDLSGNGNTATVTGATYGTDPNGGGYFELDGASDYLSIANSTDFNSAANFTIEGWFNPDNLTAVDHLFSIYGGTSDRKLFLRLNNTSGDLEWQAYNSSGTSAGSFTTSNANARLTANEWNHVAVTHINNGSMQVFVNGVSAGAGTSTGVNTTGTEDLYIGTLNTYIGTYDFDGKVGDFRFYDSALTYTQVLQNFNASKGEYGVGIDGTPTNVNFLGMAFQPDLVWIKTRTDIGGSNHFIFDSIRGATNRIFSNLTSQQAVDADSLTSFNSNGFTVDDDISCNGNGESIVAWCWKAGDTTVTDSSTGTLTADISANTAAGFSIVKYTKSGTSGTMGHGLSSAPELIMEKRTDSAAYWNVRVNGITANNQTIYLNESTGVSTHPSLNLWTTPTASVFGYDSANATAGDYIAYCFHSVDGYQRISTYDGVSGSSKRVYTTDDGTSTGNGGFRPRFVLIKNVDTSATRWMMYDSIRGTDKYLFAEESLSETTTTTLDLTFNDDGFTVPNVGSTWINDNSGATHLYLAIA